MIDKVKALELARARVAGLQFIDQNAVEFFDLSTREEAIASGIKNDPKVRDRWVICFKRVDTGHPLDGLFDSLMVTVDAETGKTEIQDSL